MRKFSLLMAALLLCMCMVPWSALAETDAPTPGSTAIEGNLLQMDKEILLKNLSENYASAAPEAYFAGYMPTSQKSGSNYKVSIPLPLKGLEKVTGKVSITVASEGLVPTNKTEIKSSTTVDTVLFDFNDLAIASATYNGTYAAIFTATYSQMIEGELQDMTQSFTVFFQVKDKTMPSEGGGGGSVAPGNAPRVMITKYKTNVEEIKAGESFTLSVDITNQSKKKKVQNVKVTLSNEAGTFLPIDGTNAAYIDAIAAGKTITKTFEFSVAPDAEPKPAMLAVEIAYEDTAGTALTENAVISLPVTQPIRMQFDPPITYETIEGEPIYVSMNVYNLGKSPVYNLMATVKGEGLSAEQAYFGGSIEAGGTKTVELAVLANTSQMNGYDGGTDGEIQPDNFEDDGMRLPQVQSDAKTAPLSAVEKDVAVMPGYNGGSSGTQVQGTVVLTYENAVGKQFSEEIAFTATVVSYVDPGFNPDPEPMPTKGNLLWLWMGLGALAIAGGVVFLVLRKRKKNRMIEDELL